VAKEVIFEPQKQNQKIVSDYIEERKTETNISESFQILISRAVNSLAAHTNKNLQDVTRDDIISWLNSVRKSEVDDPTHKWIGTYNTYLIIMITFLKWLYYPAIDAK
jgi:integrase/recombinase XerD